MSVKLPFRLNAATLTGVCAVALFTALGAVSDRPAQAQVAAKVESQTRPNFGLLLDPPTRSSRGRQHRRWNYRDHRRYGPGHALPPPPLYGTEEVVLIDCGGNPGSGGLESAAARVRPGGMLVIRSTGGPCVGWLNIDKPMTIVGDARFDRGAWGQNPRATIQAPDGQPCMTVAQGVRVEVRDVVFESRNAGDAACVVGYGATLLFETVGMRHAGDEAAIYVDGGALDIRNSVVDAQTIAPAIVSDGAVVTAYETDILRAQSGMELTPGAGQTSILSQVRMRGVESPNNFGPRAIGLLVRSGRDYGRVEVTNTTICGYVEGVAVEGASVDIQNSRICRVDKGVVLYNGEVVLTDSRVRSETAGVAASSGRAIVTNSNFSGAGQPYFWDQRAVLEASGNRLWSSEQCRPSYRPRYSGRYEIYFPSGPGWECVHGAYPRDWWGQEDGWYGTPYSDNFIGVDGYDAYRQGYGWYDQGGRYVPDRRYRGDDRWNRGGGFLRR